MSQISTRKPRIRLEIAVIIPNILLVGFIIFYFAITKFSSNQVMPLVEADRQTRMRINQLELSLERNPGDLVGALELSRLYQDVGEFPWSYDALQNAEAKGSQDPAWRLKLGLAYMELGKNDDALRVISAAQARCRTEKCPSPVLVKLQIFEKMSRLFVERRIDARKHRSAAETALREVVKPVQVDIEKMRPKAPAETTPVSAGSATSDSAPPANKRTLSNPRSGAGNPSTP